MRKVFAELLVLLSTICCLLSTPFPVYAQEFPEQDVPIPQEWDILKPDVCFKEYIFNPGQPGEQRVGVATIQGLECIFINLVRVLTPIAGLAVFIMFIVGSFQFITAGGEAKSIQKARKTLTAAIFGLVAFVGIWFILLLIKEITGVDVTKFEMPK